MKQRPAFTLMEVLVATMIFSFVGLSMMSVYFAANRNVLQNFRSDKLKSDLSTSMHAISIVMSQATRIVSPGEESSGDNLLVMTNVESGTSNPCCPMVPASYGAPAPAWYRFCVDSSNQLWYYSGMVNTEGGAACGGCPNLTNYKLRADGSAQTCGAPGYNRMLLASHLVRTVPVFSRVSQPPPLTSADGMVSRKTDVTHTRLIHSKHTINVFLNTVWNAEGSHVNDSQTPVDYTLEGFFSVMQPR